MRAIWGGARWLVLAVLVFGTAAMHTQMPGLCGGVDMTGRSGEMSTQAAMKRPAASAPPMTELQGASAVMSETQSATTNLSHKDGPGRQAV